MSVLRRSRWLLLVLLVLGGFGLTRLKFNVEVLDLLPSDIPAVQGLKTYQRHFANTRELIITLQHADPDQTELAAESLANALSREPNLPLSVQWAPPWQAEPLATSELLAFVWLNQPEPAVDQLVRRLSPDQLEPRLVQLRQGLATSFSPAEIARAGYDPFGLTRLAVPAGGGLPDFGEGTELFASPDGTFRVLYVQSRVPLAGYRECVRWMDAVQAAVDSWKTSQPTFDDVVISYTGQPAFMAEIGGGMERDMTLSVGGTLLIIAFLFLWAHRRLIPLLWLSTLLALILAGTLGFGGLWFGTLNVVSTGFAAILLGLAVDYGLVLYQEARARPEASAAALADELVPGIAWAAVTTAAAFLALNLSHLPGLAQLGSLVAVGILLAAIIMPSLFLPPLLPLPCEQPAGDPSTPDTPPPKHSPRTPLVLTVIASVLCVLILITLGLPRFDQGAEALRPRTSAAYAALEQIKQHMSGPGEPMWLLIGGTNELDVASKLDAAEAALDSARPWISGFTLPTALWAQPDRQAANRPVLASLIARREDLKLALQNQGFTDEAFALTGRVLDTWARAQVSSAPFWPDHPVSKWILDRFISRESDSLHALGLVYSDDEATAFRELRARLPSKDYQLASWAGLGEQVFESVRRELTWLSWLMAGLILAALGLAFRRVAEVVFSVATFCLAMAGLLAIMRAAGWSWNLMNLMALPLLLGTGVDYGIHIQLALRRHRGDLSTVRRTTGRALLLCGGTTIAAFGSLGWSSNAGLASLGRVCAVGIACSVLTAVYLLPTWWKLHQTLTTVGPVRPSRPSRFYSTLTWRLGLAAARFLPESWLATLTSGATALFGRLRRARFRVVVGNLMPVVGDNPPAARAAARKLFRNFGLKIAHLWTYEAGCDIEHLVGRLEGRDRFFAALNSGRGVLLISPHLGNWEFGAPLLAKHGVKLLAVTLEEPSRHLTELRRHSRRRWGIETIVIRRDPFSFLEVLRQLENGAAVALLIDRPPAGTAASVRLFGAEIDVSMAPAELARASGCILLPVYVVSESGGYHACVLPEIDYDRRSLRQMEARHALTQEIMRAFEPVIRNHPDQWYHFVPIWPAGGSPAAPRRSSSD